MELSERFIAKLENEGFTSVYEWQDASGTYYEPIVASGRKVFMVTDGSATIALKTKTTELHAGDRIDIAAGVEYSIAVGSQGWIVIIGEA